MNRLLEKHTWCLIRFLQNYFTQLHMFSVLPITIIISKSFSFLLLAREIGVKMVLACMQGEEEHVLYPFKNRHLTLETCCFCCPTHFLLNPCLLKRLWSVSSPPNFCQILLLWLYDTQKWRVPLIPWRQSQWFPVNLFCCSKGVVTSKMFPLKEYFQHILPNM